MKATFIINVPERTLCESFESNVECPSYGSICSV